MVAFRPNAIVSRLNISFDHTPPLTIFPLSTPIEPVRVPGRATIQFAGVATQYPPEPAIGPMATTSGLRAAITLRACRIASEAVDEPPLELTYRTTAAARLSSATWRPAWTT